MRPLFPKDYRNDVTLNNMVMSVDPECDPEVVAMLGSAIATCISDIPFDGQFQVGYGFLCESRVYDELAVDHTDLSHGTRTVKREIIKFIDSIVAEVEIGRAHV